MNFSPQSLMTLAGIGILCWVMMRNRWKQQKKVNSALVVEPMGHNANATGQPNTFTGTQSLGAPRDVLKWQVELHDLGRELKAELDSKMLAVRALTKQYDQAAQRLAELIRIAEEVNLGASPRRNGANTPPPARNSQTK